MQEKTEVQQELKRMRELCDNAILISDFSHSSKKKAPETINISDTSHLSRKDKKLIDHRNQKNVVLLKDSIDSSKEGVKEIPIKSQNWLAYKAKNKENESKKKPNKLKYSDQMHVSLYPLSNTFKGETPIVSLDCEMVLSLAKHEIKEKHELARVCIINYNGHILLDEFIRPKHKIINYLTWVSGITYDKIKNCQTFDHFKEKIFSMLKGKIIVGHTLKSDFEALNFDASLSKNRDLKNFKFLHDNGKVMSLKKLTEKFLKIKIQIGEHSPVEDARAALMLYKKFEKRIENEVRYRNYEEIKGQVLNDLNIK